ncbi:hypothetical protein [Microcoleus sp. bin38.metabat.b11b12b14.051]|uniref:hypothetical protein n=1 Tax=Microcoleus sp. bin38.metabat.b11b12b14.051 TaxID=2742709 RepID=UPI0025FCEE24|nr:hypothetical protein [Microcoleus sp. bin38.metabat.b11b12b14.051]
MRAVLAVVGAEPRSNMNLIFAVSMPVIVPIVDYFGDLGKICRLWLRQLLDSVFQRELHLIGAAVWRGSIEFARSH